jgi:hypothetical protein
MRDPSHVAASRGLVRLGRLDGVCSRSDKAMRWSLDARTHEHQVDQSLAEIHAFRIHSYMACQGIVPMMARTYCYGKRERRSR